MDSVITTGRQKRRPNFSVDFKRQLAQQASEPGASVSHLAQQHGINANMLFKWRRHWVAGLFDAPQSDPVMLPVTISEESTAAVPVAMGKSLAITVAAPEAGAGGARQGLIEIQIADATVRFDGHADPAMLRAVLRMLRT